jgi:hypothetical protein
MKWIAKLGRFIGEILAAMLPAFLKEWRKPRETDHIENDEDVNDAVDDSITDALDGMRRDSTSNRRSGR